jgi:hypothetical protein
MSTKVTAQMVHEYAMQLHGLDFSDTRCEELARDAERHLAAIAAAVPQIDFNDEPAKFAAQLAASAPARSKRR